MKIIIESIKQRNIPTLHIYNPNYVEKRPVVFFLHGYMGKKENSLGLAYEYAKNGYYSITFDAMHHGELKESYFDALSPLEKDSTIPLEKDSTIIEIMNETSKFINNLIDENLDNPRADMDRVGLIGFSMGGNIIFNYISKMLSERVKAAIPCISTPVWGNAFKRYVERTPEAKKYFDDLRIEEITKNQPSNFIENIKELPILIVIGDEDHLFSADDVVDYCERLRENYEDKSKVCLEIQKGVGHYVMPESMDKIELWIKKYL